jgi:transglutaminase-like putative cysteine protease
VNRRPRIDWRTAATDTAFFLMLMAVAAAALWPIYQTPRLIVLAVVCLGLGALVAGAGAVLRWPGYAVFAATIAIFFVVGVPLAVPGSAIAGVLPSIDGLRQLALGSALGWKQLVTVDLPVSSYQALLVPALVLLLGGTVAGLSLVLRARRGELAIIAPIAVIVTAIVLGPAVAWYPFALGLGFLLVSIFWMTWRARHRRRVAIALLNSQTEAQADPSHPQSSAPGSRARETGEAPIADRRGLVRPALTAVVVLAIAVGVGVSAASALPPVGPRDVLRSAVERPFDPRDYSSPLAGFRSYWGPDRVEAPLFTVTGLPSGARIRVATLDTYDGIVYSVGDAATSSESGFFARVPSTLDRSGQQGEKLTADITIDGYTGVWLPTIGDLERVGFAGPRASTLQDAFYFNRTSGTAAVLGGVREGDGYTIDAIEPPSLDADALQDARPGTADVPEPKNVPEEIESAVAEDTAGLESAGEKLAAVVSAIKDSGYISHGTDSSRPYSRSGHAADRIAELLTDPVMLGDGEQYATAVALMAHEIGFPARVVFGFAPASQSGASSIVVTGSDVAAWVEVNVAGRGWTTLDVTPPDREIPQQIPDTTKQVSRPEVVIPPPPPADDTPVEPNRPEADEKDPKPTDEFWPVVLAVLRVVGVVALVLLVLLAPAIVVGVAKLSRRRRRRRDPDEAARIAGGWQEVVDTALDYGYRPPASATRLEFAAAVARQEITGLARRADEAVFADQALRPGEADEYWRDLGLLRKSWAIEYTRWQRIRAAVAVRSLLSQRAAGKGGTGPGHVMRRG